MQILSCGRRNGKRGEFESASSILEGRIIRELPVLQLPMDRPRPAVQTHRGASQSLIVANSLQEKLKDLSLQEGCTLFMTLMARIKASFSLYRTGRHYSWKPNR